MLNDDGETLELNLGEVTGEELLLGGYEALKTVLAASVAQLTATDQANAKAIFAALANDIDVERARFIIAMREQAQALPRLDRATDPDGFECPEIIGEVEDAPSDSG